MTRRIACGRGPKLYDKPGEKIFQDIVSSFIDEYTLSTKTKRSGIVQKVYEERIFDGMKFVCKRDYGGWVVIGINEGRDKVGHRFRDEISLKSQDQTGVDDKAIPNNSNQVR